MWQIIGRSKKLGGIAITHSEILEMESKGYIGEEPKVLHTCYCCNVDITEGERVCKVDLGSYTEFYCMDCISIEVAEEE